MKQKSLTRAQRQHSTVPAERTVPSTTMLLHRLTGTRVRPGFTATHHPILHLNPPTKGEIQQFSPPTEGQRSALRCSYALTSPRVADLLVVAREILTGLLQAQMLEDLPELGLMVGPRLTHPAFAGDRFYRPAGCVISTIGIRREPGCCRSGMSTVANGSGARDGDAGLSVGEQLMTPHVAETPPARGSSYSESAMACWADSAEVRYGRYPARRSMLDCLLNCAISKVGVRRFGSVSRPPGRDSRRDLVLGDGFA